MSPGHSRHTLPQICDADAVNGTRIRRREREERRERPRRASGERQRPSPDALCVLGALGVMRGASSPCGSRDRGQYVYRRGGCQHRRGANNSATSTDPPQRSQRSPRTTRRTWGNVNGRRSGRRGRNGVRRLTSTNAAAAVHKRCAVLCVLCGKAASSLLGDLAGRPVSPRRASATGLGRPWARRGRPPRSRRSPRDRIRPSLRRCSSGSGGWRCCSA